MNHYVKVFCKSILVFSMFTSFSSCSWFSGCSNGVHEVSDKEKEKQKEEKRIIEIINNTDAVINKLVLTTGENDNEILTVENLDEHSASYTIPKEYDSYDVFTVIMIDNYDFKYVKTVSDVPKTGITQIKVSLEDRIKQDGDWWNSIQQFFNGD